MRRLAWLLVVALAALPRAGAQRSGIPSTRGADVIVIVADDVALVDVERVATPNIDALAARGLYFDRGFANPNCITTRRSLNFGRWWTNARGEFCRRADEDTPGALPSLAHTAKASGYSTALFGKWHVGSAPFGPPLGGPRFHGYDTWRAGIASNIQDNLCGGVGLYTRWKRVDDGVVREETRYTDAAVRDAFLGWWRETDGPRFAMVCFQLAHHPFVRPPDELLPPGTPLPGGTRQIYVQMVQALDTLVGQVLQVAGPEDIVVFLGDNGTPGEGALDSARAKGTTFERGIRVPFIVAAPFVRPGQVSHSLVHVADLLPTLAELGGRPVKAEDGLGRSLVPVLLDPTARIHSHVVSGWHQRPLAHTEGDPIIDRCVRSDRYKLRVDGEGREEFYDLELDPGELAPIALGDPAYHAVLDQHRKWFAQAMTRL